MIGPPLAIGLVSVLAGSNSGSSEPPRYDKDVRAILSDRCFRCHGPDAGKRQADLRLDVEESATAIREGHAAVVPGKPDESELVRRIGSTDEDVRMPPPKSGRRPLNDEEAAIVKKWIEDGAKYEPHWSFVPPARPAVPAVRNGTWPANDVDRFVLAKLEREGVAPSPEAEPAALVRRLFLDVTGLPPTPEESGRFVAEYQPGSATAETTWQRWIRRLTTEEPYKTRHAERMATPWLDASRYADTCGIHMDAGRQMWLWRDWVLAAFRDGMPFDRFVTDQIAGDLEPNATEAQKIASGFNRNHVTTDEGGAIPEEYLVEYAVDRASTTSSVFLGLTMGCARCHDHKFDPLTQDDFYRFYAFFDSIEEPGLYSQVPDANRALEPYIEVPRPEQKAQLTDLRARLDEEQKALEAPEPEQDAQLAQFRADLAAEAKIAWAEAPILFGLSSGGARIEVQEDGSALVSGPNPDKDDHTFLLRTRAKGLRLLRIDALGDKSFFEGRVGRAPNGNAVLSGVTAEAISLTDPRKREPVHFTWAWADHEQKDGDYVAANVLDGRDETGWAVDAHNDHGPRVALLLADAPFGYEEGTDLQVTLRYRTEYAQHVLGHVKLSVGTIADAGVDRLPAALSSWYLVGPFPAESGHAAFETAFGPEAIAAAPLDLAKNFGFGNQYWHADASLMDGALNNGLPAGIGATYLGRRVFAPTARHLSASLGSDDGFRLFVNGKEVASKEVDRSLAENQDAAAFDVPRGESALVFKEVNTGGLGGFYWSTAPREGELAGDLVGALLPQASRTKDLDDRIVRAWRTRFSPAYRAHAQRIASLKGEIATVESMVPRTMVMKELEKPRETFVLSRGRYDHPDASRPVTRGVPAALGKLPENAPKDRLGLAQWLVSPENPLVARVEANRTWEQVFGTGLVKTSEDFGMQGEWPSHPELLDWLAVELRESGWDSARLLRLVLESRTYRESSRARPEVRERDPEDRWLSWFPRRRLGAEEIRDQALYVSGLLAESLGGPSVKPAQPEGLWKEVAMVQSNTREYVVGTGSDLWRRSLYTYWKRACPPPTLLVLDAPTREVCVVRRASTNTPLQALAMWNDEQFVGAARGLAERTLLESGNDEERIATLFRRCTGRAPEPEETARLSGALLRFRKRYADAPEDAYALAGAGREPRAEDLDVTEVAAWTLVASAVLNLDATLVRS